MSKNSNKTIEFSALDRHYEQYSENYLTAVKRVFESSWYILGKEVEQFEQKYSSLYGVNCCVGLNSGLDALVLAIRALNIGAGDEVIVPANTYIASVIGVTENGATPVFVEPDEYFNLDSNKIEAAITNKTKAILVVHLYGQAAKMDKIKEIADKYNLFLIEDCAQSHLARYNGKLTGTFGDVGCFSFYPTKNLGAFGDAGAIITNNQDLAKKIKMLSNYGSSKKYHHDIQGVNSRLDELQAALLSTKLAYIDVLTEERKQIAAYYNANIKNNFVILPKTMALSEHVYHLYVVQVTSRNTFQEYLDKNGIKTQIHYPIPPHLSLCYNTLGYKEGDFPITELFADQVISLPIFNGMTKEEMEYVVEKVNKYEPL